jgi:hypothetical protein
MATLPARLSRRGFLVGTAGLTALAACGGDDDGGAGDSVDSGVEGAPLLRFFPDGQLPGEELRLSFGIVEEDGGVEVDAPKRLSFTFIPDGGGKSVGPIDVDRHADGVPRPYYPVRVTLPKEGVYDVRAEGGDAAFSSAVTALEAAAAPVPSPGDPLPSVPSPTVDDARGVNPICTADPACPLHEVSLDAALTAGKPVALLVSTPAFCQTAICGPVLELFVEQHETYGDEVSMIHAEVYPDPYGEGGTTATTEVVQALGLTYEPALFLADATGKVVDRLDTIFDRTEIEAAMEKLTS